MRRFRLVCILLLSGLTNNAPGQSADAPSGAPPGEPQELHWAIKLGMRSLQVEMSLPVIDRVVVVPDVATYIDELAKWSLKGRWPVLIDDDVLAPMFIRRFQPHRIIVRESVGMLPESNEARRALLEQTVVGAWGGDRAQDSIIEVFSRLGYLPPGVVITSVQDPAWTAAVALAAGRGLPLLWMDESFGNPDSALNLENTKRLTHLVDDLIQSLGYPYQDIGDGIDTIALCRAVAGRVNVELPPTRRINVPAKYRDGPLAMTDVVGRREDWNRYAFTGWIHGDEIRSAYVAMCSMFLSRERVDLINTYSTDGQWALYGMDETGKRLVELGFEVTSHQEDSRSLAAWRRSLARGFNGDVLIMNSRGNAADFHLNKDRASALDVPLHHVPVTVHLTHSWSMQSPTRLGSVAGRWLANGAYAFVGSMHEPTLGAFVPSSSLVNRFNGLVPFLVAARHWHNDGVFARPWRVNTFGDPLMLCPSSEHRARERLDRPVRYGISLAEQVRQLMEDIKTKPSPEVFASTIKSLNLWGRDELLVQVWELAKHHSMAQDASKYMPDVFFRLGSEDAFIQAWGLLDEPNERQRDLLWHRLGSRLGPRIDRDTLLLLESGMRRSLPQIDAGRLAPHFDRVFGRSQTRGMLERALAIALDATSENRIKKLLGNYPEQ